MGPLAAAVVVIAKLTDLRPTLKLVKQQPAMQQRYKAGRRTAQMRSLSMATVQSPTECDI